MSNNFFRRRINGSSYGDVIEEYVDGVMLNQYIVLLDVLVDGNSYCVLGKMDDGDVDILGKGIDIWNESVKTKLYAYRYVSNGIFIQLFGINEELAEKLVHRAIQKSSDRYTQNNQTIKIIKTIINYYTFSCSLCIL